MVSFTNTLDLLYGCLNNTEKRGVTNQVRERSNNYVAQEEERSIQGQRSRSGSSLLTDQARALKGTNERYSGESFKAKGHDAAQVC